MKINKNDPRLTAYLLNELNSEERKTIELALAQDAELRSHFEELRKAVLWMQNEMSQAPQYALTANQREKILGDQDSRPFYLRPLWITISSGAVLASLALILFKPVLDKEMSKNQTVISEMSPGLAPAKKDVGTARSEVVQSEKANESERQRLNLAKQVTKLEQNKPAPVDAPTAPAAGAKAPAAPQTPSAEAMADASEDFDDEYDVEAEDKTQAKTEGVVDEVASADAKGSMESKNVTDMILAKKAKVLPTKSADAGGQSSEPVSLVKENLALEFSVKTRLIKMPNQIKEDMVQYQIQKWVTQVEVCTHQHLSQNTKYNNELIFEWRRIGKTAIYKVTVLKDELQNASLNKCISDNIQKLVWPYNSKVKDNIYQAAVKIDSY